MSVSITLSSEKNSYINLSSRKCSSVSLSFLSLEKPHTASVQLTMSTAEPEHERRTEEEAAGADDEDTGAQVAPIVRLEEVAVTTGEENEDAILDL